MVTIGVDPHKDAHHAVAVDMLGKQLSERQCAAEADCFGEMLAWARGLDDDGRVWVLEDFRHVSGPFERFLLDHGESVARLAPHLMAQARTHVRERGKSDPIDALAVARRLGAGIGEPPDGPAGRGRARDPPVTSAPSAPVKQPTALIQRSALEPA